VAAEVPVTFKVLVQGVQEGETVYITGNHEKLGAWNSAAVPLQRDENGVWTATISFEAGANLEYKFTRGSWDNEALEDGGAVPRNALLTVAGEQEVSHTINQWKDQIFISQGGITGTVERHENMEAEGLFPRDVLVWLPPSYAASPERRYPVLYMHDGQQVFDPATSTWGVDWGVDEAVTELSGQGKIEEVIVVGINNTADRRDEYGWTEKGTAYRKFVVEKVKPFIDGTYRTMPGREHTAVMGSSMGGLVSFLLIWQHPDVFSMAGCLSPAFRNEEMLETVRAGEAPAHIRIYMDNGGVGLEEELQPGCEAMLEILKEKDFEQDGNLIWFRDMEAEHNEAAWAKRVWRPLTWFFGEEPQMDMNQHASPDSGS